MWVYEDKTASSIQCLGDIVAERVVGGQSCAFLGFEVDFLGSEDGVETVIQPGKDYRLEVFAKRLKAIDDELAALIDAESAGANEAPAEVTGSPKNEAEAESSTDDEGTAETPSSEQVQDGDAPAPDNGENVQTEDSPVDKAELRVRRADELRSEREALAQRQQEVSANKATPITMVNVGQQLCQEVVIVSGDASTDFKEAISGQHTICRDDETGDFKIGAYRPRPI